MVRACKKLLTKKKLTNLILTKKISPNYRCFVGDEPDQWRKCSDRYFPGNNTHQGITYAPGDKRKPEHYQQPPRPGGLHSLTEFTAARLWPVTYLYSEGPPNSTELSNFVDCNKENCKRR